jgi:hypothetical protein
LAVLVVLVRKGLPRPGHIEKGKFALWIVGFLGEQDALCRVHSINACLSVTQHLPIPPRQKTQRLQTAQAGFCSRTAKGTSGKLKRGQWEWKSAGRRQMPTAGMKEAAN